jgi:catechol 2,3-dioxygenase-like lactoylglutathione lyase family enzyme
MTAPAPVALPVRIATPGVHHVTLRCTDLDRARVFYVERLGFTPVFDTPELLLFMAGATAVALRGPDPRTPADDAFDPFRVGLDHLALGCEREAELHRVADALAAAGVDNTGVRVDPALGKPYVAFRDPDGIKWELYLV